MQAALKTSLPIMITEWNYAPNVTSQDQKGKDATFVKSWTTQALQTLARNQVYASMQYALLGPSTALVASNKSMTPQGVAFQQLYGSMVLAHQATPTSTVEATPTATPTPEATATPDATATMVAVVPTVAIVPTPTATLEVTPMPLPVPTPTVVVAPTPTPVPAPFMFRSEAEASSNTLAGRAVLVACSTCSGARKVDFLGSNSGTLQFNNIVVRRAGTFTLTIYYCSGVARDALMSIDGGVGTRLTFASTGSFNTPRPFTVFVRLNAGSNTIKFSNPSGWAPDLDRIVIYA
jgi:Carbohydrate binding module (family 35)